MKLTKDAVTLSLDEFAALLGDGTHICKCGKVTPLPAWYKASGENTCPLCKDLPSREELGIPTASR